MSLQHNRPADVFSRSDVASSNNRASFKFFRRGVVDLVGLPAGYARNVEIYGEGEPSDYYYIVVSGAVRTYKVLADGRRQISAFHFRGDFFGLEADESHAMSAEAIVDSKVLMMKRSALLAQAEQDKEVARELWAMNLNELKRVQAHMLLLIKTAKERVAEFLLEMADRVHSDEAVELPMSRQDIADYLGLTIETISRTLTDLEKDQTISLPNSRRVVLHDRDMLNRYVY
jgi:CRP/FNR family nitrogen fixation transcriptional regulator